MLPIQITAKEISVTPAIETLIRKRADKLKQYFDRISSCRVVIELPQKHKHQGKLYNVRIDITVPGKEMVATRQVDQDIYVALRDAFAAIERQLEEHSRKRHGHVKTHEESIHGTIARILSTEGYGFIEDDDGTEYYFSVTNVHYPTFKQLSIGDRVEFKPEPFNDGWQAHHVVKERNV